MTSKPNRETISILELTETLFPDEAAAREWFETLRWPDGQRDCPRCDSGGTGVVKSGKPMPYWCPICRKYFSVKVGTVMQSSNLPLRKWVIALYLLSTNLKGVASTKLAKDLGVSQKTAWFMAQKIREAWSTDGPPLSGHVEVDETYLGGKYDNMHQSKKPFYGNNLKDNKIIVAGAKQRDGKIKAEVVPDTKRSTLQGFVASAVEPGSTVYTDDHISYKGMADVDHHSVKHSAGEYVKGMAHTNGIESFWAMLKRGYTGTYHKMSLKHLRRYVLEFAGRANVREHDTIVQMMILAAGMVGKRLRWQDLTA